MGITVTTTPTGTYPSGRYYSRVGIENIYGQNNVRQWSNKEGDANTADDAAITAAGVWAENQLDRRLRAAGYAAPLASTSKDFAVWCDLVNELAGVRLYMGRGEVPQTQGNAIAGQMESHRKHVEDELEEMLRPYVPGTGLDCPRAMGIVDAPVSIAPEADPITEERRRLYGKGLTGGFGWHFGW